MQTPPRSERRETEEAPQMGLFSDPQPEPADRQEALETARRPLPAPGTEFARREQRGRPRARSANSTLPAWAFAAMKPPVAPERESSEPPPSPAVALPDQPEEPDSGPGLSLQESRRLWTVGDLVASVRTHVEQAWPDLWVHGEISNLRTAPSGHLYFTLKDGEAQLPAVLFRRQAQLLRFKPEDGMQVRLRGKLSVYEQRGQMQLIAEYLEPEGEGALRVAFEQLRARLGDEGLFRDDRKRPLPPYPRCVGIITSPAGAVIHDFLTVASRRHAALDILLYPALVQGESAAADLAAGIAYFNRMRNVDLIVIARGGGSLEDLAPFNTEVLARAIVVSSLPVVSAVGHETDFTIADFVADLRAPTPSAAAELITAAQYRVAEQVAELAQRLGRACRYQLILARQRLGALSMQATRARLTESLNRREQRIDTLRFRMEAALRTGLHSAAGRVAQHSVDAAFARLRASFGERARMVEGLRFRLEALHMRQLQAGRERLQGATAALLRQDPHQRLQVLRGQLATLDAGLRRAGLEQLRGPAQRRESLARQLDQLSPLAVLSRGYSLVFNAEGVLIKRAAEVSTGERLTLRLGEGTVRTIATGEA